MDGNDNNGAGGPPQPGQWRGRKQRDDTPSFIRNVQARADLLNPSRGEGEALPVLAMPKSVRIWRQIRWPLFVVLVVALLSVVAFVTNDRLVARSVARKIAEARERETTATVAGLLEAEGLLGALADRHHGRRNAQLARAWHAVLLAELMGPEDGFLAKAEESLARVGGADDGGDALLVRAGVEHLRGNHQKAIDLTTKGLEQAADEPRLLLVRSWALAGLGRDEAARDQLAALMDSSPEYLPALHTALDMALGSGDGSESAELAMDLLTRSPGNLFGSLASVTIRLPEWGEPPPSSEALASLVEDGEALGPRLEVAPPKLAVLGRYVTGRVALLAGDEKRAMENLGAAVESGMGQEALAWWAMAIRESEGPGAAFEALRDAGGEDASPEVLDVRARCLLDHHKVDAAAEVLGALKKRGGYLGGSLSNLEWAIAVRFGDLEAASSALPDAIPRRHGALAREMYYLLRFAGDAEGVEDLAGRMENGDLSECAEAIRAWHDGGVERAAELLSESGAEGDGCVAALTAHLMPGHRVPAEIVRAADLAAEAEGGSGVDLSLEVDRARALWLSQGRDRAVEALDAVWSLEPQGSPLRCAMARLFSDMGLPERSLEVLDGLSDGESTALRIGALAEAERKAEADRALESALSDEALRESPGVVYRSMVENLGGAQFDRVVELADEALPRAGRWIAEIAEAKAKALNAKGSRGDADRSLAVAARSARRSTGLDEAWECKLALIRLNLRRGGNFLFKAVSVTAEMYNAGVKDPELSYSYAVAHIRQGNERGAVRFLRESMDLDPSFTPSYSQLRTMGKLPDEQAAILERTRPGAQP